MSIIYKPTDTIAHGRYEVIRLIGEGGAGIVYQCKERPLLNDVAVKVLRHELIEDKKLIGIFRHEARLAAQLQHPHIVSVFEVNTDEWEDKQIYFLAMEYLPGGTLTARIKAGLTIELAFEWMKQLLQAVGYAHEKGVIHQDIKGGNVLLTEDDQVKIGDFGLARLSGPGHFSVEEESLSEKKIKFMVKTMGTPAYMSPELCYGEIQDERSDIYSLGVLFFEMLTGQMPFEAQGMIELPRQHISKPVPSVRRIKPEIPSILDDMVKRMMAKDKDERFQSTRQILSMLEP